MKQTTRTSRTAGQLEKMFRKLNEHYFREEIDEPVITITKQRTSYGYCTTKENWTTGKESKRRYEISIASEQLSRPIEEVTATLLHEMVHLWNLQNGIQDCSRNGTYHNRKFKKKAEEVDLKIEHHELYGWTITSPTEKLIDFIISEGWQDILMAEDWDLSGLFGISGKGDAKGNDDEKGNEPTKKTSWRYKCQKCGLIVRSTKDLTGKLMCTDCNEILTE